MLGHLRSQQQPALLPLYQNLRTEKLTSQKHTPHLTSLFPFGGKRLCIFCNHRLGKISRVEEIVSEPVSKVS